MRHPRVNMSPGSYGEFIRQTGNRVDIIDDPDGASRSASRQPWRQQAIMFCSRFVGISTIARGIDRTQSIFMRTPVITRTRAPLRLGLAGGGTDLSPYSEDLAGPYSIARSTAMPMRSLRRVRMASWPSAPRIWMPRKPSPDTDAASTSKLALHRGVYLRMCREFNNGKPVPITITTTVDAPAGIGPRLIVRADSSPDRCLPRAARSAARPL